jgi:hypothetical protein
LLWVLAQSRYLGAADLARMLNAIAAKLATPTEQVYLYGEDQRLSYAVVTALLRDLLDLPTLNAWLDELVHPASRDWKAAFTSLDTTNAYHNTTTFLRSLYFQLLFGIKPPSWYPDRTLYERTPALRDALLPMIAGALKQLDRGFYAQEPET